MSVLSILSAAGGGGCNGGIQIYFTAKAFAEARNVSHKRIKLSASTKAKMKPLFPNLDLNKVRIRTGCDLPPNWFIRSDQTPAMTFGYTIYFERKHVQKDIDGLNLLMHELVHVDQVRRRNDNETLFACAYGKGYVKGGSYLKNPLEIEAYDFVAANAFKVDWSSSGSLDKPEKGHSRRPSGQVPP